MGRARLEARVSPFKAFRAANPRVIQCTSLDEMLSLPVDERSGAIAVIRRHRFVWEQPLGWILIVERSWS